MSKFEKYFAGFFSDNIGCVCLKKYGMRLLSFKIVSLNLHDHITDYYGYTQ